MESYSLWNAAVCFASIDKLWGSISPVFGDGEQQIYLVFVIESRNGDLIGSLALKCPVSTRNHLISCLILIDNEASRYIVFLNHVIDLIVSKSEGSDLTAFVPFHFIKPRCLKRDFAHGFVMQTVYNIATHANLIHPWLNLNIMVAQQQ